MFTEQIAAALAVVSLGQTTQGGSSPATLIDSPSSQETETMSNSPLTIGCLVFPRQDQIDFTGPFEVLSRLPDSTVHVISKDGKPLRDIKGLILTPEMKIAESPPLDLLLVSGGLGQQQWMEDEEILSFIRKQAESGRYVFSVCTGALLCGAAGILRGRRATTHWTAWDLLHYYGAIPVKSRVVVDGKLISAAGLPTNWASLSPPRNEMSPATSMELSVGDNKCSLTKQMAWSSPDQS